MSDLDLARMSDSAQSGALVRPSPHLSGRSSSAVQQIPVRTAAVILSTMRAGSTLLKALLAEASDISNLPEINFQRFAHRTDAWQKICARDSHRIVVLKRPAWYWDLFSYPVLPDIPLKAIILHRDVYDTVVSLRQMTFGKAALIVGPLVNKMLIEYWVRVNQRLLEVSRTLSERACSITYERLVDQPTETTAGLFAFLGSSQQQGVDQYRRPRTYFWKWGSDDGGEKIKGLRVCPPKAHRSEDRRLLNAIGRAPRAIQLRAQLGYC